MGLTCIERKQNIKFPEEYKRINQSDFKEIDNRIEIYAEDNVFCISKFITATEINNIGEMF